jgi:hypothetical protein
VNSSMTVPMMAPPMANVAMGLNPEVHLGRGRA